MDIETLKEKFSPEKFDALKSYVEGEAAKLKTVRKKADEYAARLRDADALSARMMERLGIASAEELDSLPDAKGQAEAFKQAEVRIKRLEAELTAAAKERDTLTKTLRESRQAAILAKTLAGHDVVDADVVGAFISSRLQWDGDDLLYRTDTDALVPVKDGVASLLKSRPALVKTPGARGSGMKPAARGGDNPDNPFAKQTWNITQQVQLARDNPKLAAELKQAAAAAAAA